MGSNLEAAKLACWGLVVLGVAVSGLAIGSSNVLPYLGISQMVFGFWLMGRLKPAVD
jgi:hypothetical protein